MDSFMKDIGQAASAAMGGGDPSSELPRSGVIASPFGEIDFSKDRESAEQIWSMLNDMADKNPEVRYEGRLDVGVQRRRIQRLPVRLLIAGI